MADNAIANNNGSPVTFATDDIGAGVQSPRMKLMLGADGVDDGNVSSANPLPVSTGGLTDAQLRATTLETQDDALYDLVDTLNDLVSRLGILLSARAVDGTLRVSGTVTTSIATVTTLTTLANQAAMGGYQTTASIQNQMNTVAQLANTANVG